MANQQKGNNLVFEYVFKKSVGSVNIIAIIKMAKSEESARKKLAKVLIKDHRLDKKSAEKVAQGYTLVSVCPVSVTVKKKK